MLGRGASTSAGVNVTTERAMLYATVYACVKVLAESVGQIPLHLYQRSGREKHRAIDHSLYGILHDAPNEFQTAQEWREFQIASLALRGNGYSQIVRVRNQVAELLPFLPGAVTPKQHRASLEVVYEVTLADGKKETLPAREVLHLKLMSLDGLTGLSPVHQARESIGLGIGAEQYGATLFQNGASPGGVLQFPTPLSDEAYERLKTSWEDRHQGSSNAHKVAILEAGGTWKEIGMPAKDAQFLETRKYQRSEVTGLFRVPPHLIGDLERATFGNIEHQSLDFVTHGLMPYLTRIEQRIAMQLLTPAERREYFARFNVAGLLRGDMAARSAFYKSQFDVGALSPNEIRELEERNPRSDPGGDAYFTPLNLASSQAPEQ